MNTFIIRKPFRNEIAMRTYIDMAEAISKTACDPELSLGQRYEMLLRVSECLDKAADAGGFFNTKDFLRWMDTQNNA